MQIGKSAAAGTVVRKVIGNDVDDDLDIVLFRLGTQRCQLNLCSEPRVVRYGKAQRLVQLPPLVFSGGVVRIIILRAAGPERSAQRCSLPLRYPARRP